MAVREAVNFTSRLASIDSAVLLTGVEGMNAFLARQHGQLRTKELEPRRQASYSAWRIAQ
ncbi:hypothetical protein AB0M72_29485 [Nocardiopsis dassonvillei]